MTATVTPLLRAVPMPPTEAEWLDLRSTVFNASNVAALWGEHPFVTLDDIAREKSEGIRQPETGRMRLGKALESGICALWEEEHGVPVRMPASFHLRGRLGATPDRELVGTDDLLEAKLTFDDCPTLKRHWYWQAMAQLACTGAERVHFAVASPDGPHLDWCVTRDEEAIAAIDEGVASFWAALGLGLLPEPMRLDARTVPIELGSIEANTLRHWLSARHLARTAKDETAEYRAKLEATLGVAGYAPGSRLMLMEDGEPLARVRVQRGRKRLNRDALAGALAAAGYTLADFEEDGPAMTVWEEAS